MQASVKKQIGDFEYEITKPLAEQGLEFSLAVGKYCVPFMVQLVAALETGNVANIMAAASQLLVSLSPADLKYLNTTLGEMTQLHHPDGRIQVLRRDVFQQHFADRYDEWITWIVFGVQTVCGSFFNGALGLGALLKKKSQNVSASTGSNPTGSNTQSPNPVERTG